jgi:hypothetical protein
MGAGEPGGYFSFLISLRQTLLPQVAQPGNATVNLV